MEEIETIYCLVIYEDMEHEKTIVQSSWVPQSMILANNPELHVNYTNKFM